MLSLEMSMHLSDFSTTIAVAELIFWYWNDKEIAILQVGWGDIIDFLASPKSINFQENCSYIWS
jgi:hypothetical protein